MTAANKLIKELQKSEGYNSIWKYYNATLANRIICKFFTSQFRDKELIEKLLNQLKEAKNIIRGWHGIGTSGFQEKAVWEIYDKNSPEMKRINDVIAEVESEISALQEAREPEFTGQEEFDRIRRDLEAKEPTGKDLRKEFENLTGKGTEIPGFKDEPITFTQSYVHWLEKCVLQFRDKDKLIEKYEEFYSFIRSSKFDFVEDKSVTEYFKLCSEILALQEAKTEQTPDLCCGIYPVEEK